MEIKENLREILFDDRRKFSFQLISSSVLGLTLGILGIPLKIYREGIATCDSIGCGSGQPPQLLEANIAINIIIWYILIGVLYSVYKRWKS